MMTVKELKECLDGLGDDVLVYVEADHGQCPYGANYLNCTMDDKKSLDYDGEEIDFTNGYEDVDMNKVTAILIS